MKFAIAGIFEKEFPGRMNYQHTLQVIKAEGEDEAIGFFIKIGFDKFPDYALFLRPTCVKIENETEEAPEKVELAWQKINELNADRESLATKNSDMVEAIDALVSHISASSLRQFFNHNPKFKPIINACIPRWAEVVPESDT